MNFKHILFLITVFVSSVAIAQQTKVADFIKADVDVTIDPYKQRVSGTVTYLVDILDKTDSLYLDAQHTNFSDVRWNGKKVTYEVTDKYLILRKKLKVKEGNTLEFTYETTPKKAMYFVGWDFEDARKQVWTQGQGKYTSNWLPSFDDVNEKVIFNLSVAFLKDYEVIANGALVSSSMVNDTLKKWNYEMQYPMSSYLLAIAAGKYKYKTVMAASGKELLLYYYPNLENRYEPTYRYSKEIFDFFEKEIGVPFGWSNYKQIPVKDFMYGGMENTTATIFNDSYYIDSLSFVDRNYVNVNGHELAHQWFGDLITEATPEDHWLQEGFATYYALLAEKKIFGDAYFKASLFDNAAQLKYQDDSGNGESILNPKAGSLTFYQKGAWALVALAHEVGHDNFRKGIKKYLQKYQYKNVTTDEFLFEIESVSGKNLTDFKERWLENTHFLYEEAMQLLEDKPYSLPNLVNEKFKDTSSVKATDAYKELWNTMPSEYKQRVISYRYNVLKDSFFIKSALADKNVLVRQAYIVQTQEVPSYLQETFEGFLVDSSYNTIENVLYKLWINFPEKRGEYLDKTKTVKGFNDLNIRVLWLALALATPDYSALETKAYFDELSGYTSPKYDYNVREKAFGFLLQMDAFTNANLKDLVDGCLHHSWSFASRCRTILDKLLDDPVYKERFQNLLEKLSDKEQNYLKKKL
ncbi:M1 family metallopeptidase [Neptunitalea lumnitzerae]|uniref:Aminopeptidase N n=1 Tax=Neptunitalea lumnitzerae TaxID=2965509 RepID=A0ABQ5MIK9_9FLAO|nr:M1 family metallopeptidase [Neptunitalea sp. Y10]GLB49233.1 aminopeptidase [Neptunitalea sp. Y10]